MKTRSRKCISTSTRNYRKKKLHSGTPAPDAPANRGLHARNGSHGYIPLPAAQGSQGPPALHCLPCLCIVYRRRRFLFLASVLLRGGCGCGYGGCIPAEAAARLVCLWWLFVFCRCAFCPELFLSQSTFHVAIYPLPYSSPRTRAK
jgi:hypothetical protein